MAMASEQLLGKQSRAIGFLFAISWCAEGAACSESGWCWQQWHRPNLQLSQRGPILAAAEGAGQAQSPAGFGSASTEVLLPLVSL